MENDPSMQFSSSPSSLPDGLLCSHSTSAPVPHPRKSASPCFTSTPKQLLNNAQNERSSSMLNGYELSVMRKSPGPNNGTIHRTASLDSSSSNQLLLSVSKSKDAHSDSETEEDNGCYKINSMNSSDNPRLCNSHRIGKHFRKYNQLSHSLPATPRVNGASSSPVVLGSSPQLVPSPYCTTDVINTSQTSQSNSHYLTCSSAFLNETKASESSGLKNVTKLPNSIDYSSLPIPHDEYHVPVNNKDIILRHLSEPCLPNTKYMDCYLPYSPRVTSRQHKLHSLGRDRLSNIKEHSEGKESKSFDTLEIQWRFIQTLVEELNNTKSSNRKLTGELHQAHLEVQMLKASLDALNETGVLPGSVTEMVEQIHAAQKMRDEAMMSRIKLANEERDSAMKQVQSLLQRLSLSPRISENFYSSGLFPLSNSSVCCKCMLAYSENKKYHHDSTLSKNYNVEPGEPSQVCDLLENVNPDEGSSRPKLSSGLQQQSRNILSDTLSHISNVLEDAALHMSGDVVEAIQGHLQDGAACRWQLQETCVRLHELVTLLQAKLSSGIIDLPHTHVDLTLKPKGPEGDAIHVELSSSEGDPKDSLSSVESTETCSASSWKRFENHSGSGSSKSWPGGGRSSPPHRNIPGVTIMGPITEL